VGTCYWSPNHLLLRQLKPQTLKNESLITLPEKFKIKTQTVDSAREIGGFTNWKIVKKWFNFGGLNCYTTL
jgi:hypothetical protein